MKCPYRPPGVRSDQNRSDQIREYSYDVVGYERWIFFFSFFFLGIVEPVRTGWSDGEGVLFDFMAYGCCWRGKGMFDQSGGDRGDGLGMRGISFL